MHVFFSSAVRMLIRLVFMLMFSIVFAEAVDIHKLRWLAARKNVICALVFGDSSADPGNNNRLNTTFKSNFLPYGKDFFNKIPTGRFTNGKLGTDIIATALGHTESIPAFLDPNLKKKNLITGVSFASAGSGYDDLTANFTSVFPMSKQLEYLKHYKIHLRKLVGKKNAESLVRNAIFMLSMGTNDFIQNYFLQSVRPKQFNLEEYVNYLTVCTEKNIKEMHRLGATRLVIIGVPPIGCMPLVKTLEGATKCVDRYNKAAILFNSKIRGALPVFEKSLSGLKIVYADIYNIFDSVFKSPMKYGFAEATKGCCGSRTFECAELCRGLKTCDDPSSYVFWDAVHPTERMYKMIADHVLELVYVNILV